MRCILTDPQRHWQRIAIQIAREVLAPRAAEIDREGRFPSENFKAFESAGLMGLPVGEELGGPGADIVTLALVTESLAEGCASSALCYHMHVSAAWLIANLAAGEQVDRFVEPILRGNTLCTYAISEPGSGSRWWHMESFAEKDDDHYIIESYKSFATSAGHADLYVVPLRATSDSPPHEFSIFLVERERANVVPVGIWDAMGMRGNCSTPVHFQRCRVPVGNRLGEAALGFPLLMAYGLPLYQVGLAAVYSGLAKAALEFAVSHSTKRIHADTALPLSRVETVQRYVAEAKLRIDQTRLFVLETARYIDSVFEQLSEPTRVIENDDFLQTIAEVKVVACEAASFVTRVALQICGGTGYGRRFPVERYYRDASAGSIMGPSDDVLRVLIGERALGLPFPWEG